MDLGHHPLPAPLVVPRPGPPVHGLPADRPFTWPEAEAAGFSSRELRALVIGGRVRRLLRGVYAAASLGDDLDTRVAALALVVPADGVVVDRTAAWLHGVDLLPRSALTEQPPVELFLPPGRRVRRDSVGSGERTFGPTDVLDLGGVRVTSPLRTALDLGRRLWRFDALAALDGFVRAGVPLELLGEHVERFRGHRGVVQLRHLVPLADGRAEAPSESALRLWWYDAGLPTPELQIWVGDEERPQRYRIDLGRRRQRFAVEYDGVAAHGSLRQQAYDTGRRDWLHREGWVTLVFGSEIYRPGADPTVRLRQGWDLACSRPRF